MEPIVVSVLITAFNRERYIAAAIESVLASTFKNLELIIVDDGSKDATVEIANTYAAKDARISVHVNKENLGDYPNRNKAATYATGKYLKYVDADDYIYPWGLELMVGIMEQFPEAGWGLCSLDQYDPRPFPFQLSPSEAYQFHYNGPGLFHKAPLSSIIRRDCFNSVDGFRAIRMAGDFDMWHRLAQKYPVVLMPQGIVWYRKHGEQEMNSFRKFAHVYDQLKINFLQSSDCPLAPEMKKMLLRSERSKVTRAMIKNLLTLKVNDTLHAYNRWKEYRKGVM